MEEFFPLLIVAHAFCQHRPDDHAIISFRLALHRKNSNRCAIPKFYFIPDRLFYITLQDASQLPVVFSNSCFDKLCLSVLNLRHKEPVAGERIVNCCRHTA